MEIKPELITIEGVGILGIDKTSELYDMTIAYTPEDPNLPIEFLSCKGNISELYHEGQLVGRYFIWDYFMFTTIMDCLREAICSELEQEPFDENKAAIHAVLKKAVELKIVS